MKKFYFIAILTSFSLPYLLNSMEPWEKIPSDVKEVSAIIFSKDLKGVEEFAANNPSKVTAFRAHLLSKQMAKDLDLTNEENRKKLDALGIPYEIPFQNGH